MTRLWQTLLGTLIISCLACGDSGSGGTGHDGGVGLDGGEMVLDGPISPADLPLPPPDQAVPGIDQAPAGIDQAPAVDLGTMKLDAGADADVRAADTLAVTDVPVQPDLLATPDLLVKQDVTSGPDLRVPPDLPQTQDLRPPADLPLALDVSSQTDIAPAPDTSTGIDATAVVDTGGDTAPQILWPDKLTYSPGEQLTAHFTNGSTDSAAWIGIFPVAAGDNAYRDYEYTGGATSGTVVLHVPGTPGTYDLRMFQDIGYTRIATSVPFVVQ